MVLKIGHADMILKETTKNTKKGTKSLRKNLVFFRLICLWPLWSKLFRAFVKLAEGTTAS